MLNMLHYFLKLLVVALSYSTLKDFSKLSVF